MSTPSPDLAPSALRDYLASDRAADLAPAIRERLEGTLRSRSVAELVGDPEAVRVLRLALERIADRRA